MMSAVGKWFRAFFDLITFRVGQSADEMRVNPGAMSASYERVIKDKRSRLNQYKDAIASMIAQEETKKQKLKALTEDIDRLKRLQAGAAAKAKKIAAGHKGDAAATRNDPEYQKCQAAYRDFGSTLEEKEQHAIELEDDLQQLVENVEGHKLQIESLMREVDELREEKNEAVADIISAKEEREVADMLTGLGDDKTAEELRELRELRQKAAADARVSRELAGLDATRAEKEFLDFAQESEVDAEFDALIGIAAEADSEQSSEEETRVADATKIPEE